MATYTGTIISTLDKGPGEPVFAAGSIDVENHTLNVDELAGGDGITLKPLEDEWHLQLVATEEKVFIIGVDQIQGKRVGFSVPKENFIRALSHRVKVEVPDAGV